MFAQFSLTYIHQWGGLSQLHPSDLLEEKPWGSQPVHHLFYVNKHTKKR